MNKSANHTYLSLGTFFSTPHNPISRWNLNEPTTKQNFFRTVHSYTFSNGGNLIKKTYCSKLSKGCLSSKKLPLKAEALQESVSSQQPKNKNMWGKWA